MKRFFPCVAVLVLLVAGCKTRSNEVEPTKVLMIGNSFSISLMSEMPKVAESLGVDLDLTSLYIGGCSLERHVKNLEKGDADGFAPYQLDRNVRGKAKDKAKANLAAVLTDPDVQYDIITIQQASHYSWNESSYYPWGEVLVEAIRRYQPRAKIYIQETWSYTPWDKRLAKWGMDQNEMYAKLHDVYAAFAKKHDLEVVPTGTAVQMWRSRLPVVYTENSLGGDVVGGRGQKQDDLFKRNLDNSWSPNCDVFHLNESGEYLQALVWVAKLFNEDVSECVYAPKCVKEAEAALMKSIACELR